MNDSIKPMCYGSTDLKDSLQAMLERDTGTNYADLHKNGQRIQALGKARAKQEKVIASVRARLAAAEGKVPTIAIDLKETDDPGDMVPAVKIVAMLTVLSVAPAILLMMTNPSMIKRPVLDTGGKLLVGFKPDQYEGALGHR